MGNRPAADPDPRLTAMIKMKVDRLVGRRGFRPGDADDLRQELWARVLAALPRHDPGRGSLATFADRVAGNAAAGLARYEAAKMRDRRRRRSLADPRCTEPADPRGGADRVDLALAVREVLDAMPPDLRRVATLLAETTEAGVARRTGLTRQRIRTMVAKIARRLREGGLSPN